MSASGVATKVPCLLVWIRQELRIHDNPVLFFQPRQGGKPFARVIPVFIFDPHQYSTTHDFGLSRYSYHRARFLLESVEDFKANLRKLGSDLVVRTGNPAEELVKIAQDHEATDAIWAHHVGTEEDADAVAVKGALVETGVVVHPQIWESTLVNIFDLPFDDVKRDLPLSYTAFRKRVEQGGDLKIRKLVPSREKLEPLPSGINIGTLPTIQEFVPNIDDGWAKLLGPDFRQQISESFDETKVPRFRGGETSALERWRYWAWEKDKLRTYKETRNGLVGDQYSSQLSPYLALGLISPRYIYWETKRYEETFNLQGNENTYWLRFELLWRDYFKFLALKLGNGIFKLHGAFPRYAIRPWLRDQDLFKKWALGQTGFPFVDAAMIELRMTGFMSNRARQVVASFLTKDLGLDWRIGAEWFESQLLDHDVASNYGNWQYNSGVGVDPREDRYFNLDKQTKVYDPDGEFRRTWRNATHITPCIDQLGKFAGRSDNPYQSPVKKSQASPAKKKVNTADSKRSSESGGNKRGGGNNSGGPKLGPARDIREFFKSDD